MTSSEAIDKWMAKANDLQSRIDHYQKNKAFRVASELTREYSVILDILSDLADIELTNRQNRGPG